MVSSVFSFFCGYDSFYFFQFFFFSFFPSVHSFIHSSSFFFSACSKLVTFRANRIRRGKVSIRFQVHRKSNFRFPKENSSTCKKRTHFPKKRNWMKNLFSFLIWRKQKDLGIMASYIIANVYFHLQHYSHAESILESNIKILEKFGCESKMVGNYFFCLTYFFFMLGHVYYILSLNMLIECKLANSFDEEDEKTLQSKILAEKFFNAWKVFLVHVHSTRFFF